LNLSVAIIDYGSGNLHSAQKAFERAALDIGYAGKIFVTSDPDVIGRADRIVLPGVGAYADCRRGLESVPGLIAAMTQAVQEKARPFLGICVGMQLLATRGLEHEICPGLDWIKGDVLAIEPKEAGKREALKIPHMGWNTLEARQSHALLAGIPLGEEGLHAYFVHSYAFRPVSNDSLIATTDYGGEIVAMVGQANVAGTQFHPEKSQTLGLALIANFLRWKP
jgi:glutamine amidotransferase